jgi:glutaminyl-peptide cyclotransferase
MNKHHGAGIGSTAAARRRFQVRSLCAALAAVLLANCGGKPPGPTGSATPKAAVGPADLWKEFSGEKAFAEVEKQVGFGPRVAGSEALEKARGHISDSLKGNGWEVERQAFNATPLPGQGTISYVNLIARFSGTAGQPADRTTQRVLIGSHYDTKYMPGQNFVGANDAGSSTGALLEMARVLAKAPALAQQIELVFFDGEEALESFGSAEKGPDGLVGSRHYASQLRATERARQFRSAVVWDMMGDKDLKLTLPFNTPPALADGLLRAAGQLGLSSHVGKHSGEILDDHEPIARIARIPAIDMIDFDYPPWHTAGDTLDKLSPDSLRIIGQITIVFLQGELSR